MRQIFCLIGACAVLAGCASAGNSIVSGEYFHPSVKRDRWPVFIVAADGLYQGIPRDVYLDPGTHTLILVSRKPPVMHPRSEKVFQFKTEACKRYYLAAQHPGPLSDKWNLVVDHVEELPWCSADTRRSGVTTSTDSATKGSGIAAHGRG